MKFLLEVTENYRVGTEAEAKELIEYVQSKLGTDTLAFYAGVHAQAESSFG